MFLLIRHLKTFISKFPVGPDGIRSFCPLGSAHHNCVHLLPTYKIVLKREKTMTKDIKAWSEEFVLSLQDCSNFINLDIFRQSYGDDLDSLVNVTCSHHLLQGHDNHPNNKPLVNISVKSCFQRKLPASDLHSANKILQAEQNYKLDLDRKLAANELG